ncbi:MAG TPA: Ig-like domain-containing protein [Verrucomicrobiae bacterium]|nr:Ig-like domain-containing protein [Verrucomicrobiae bacterium]
MKKQKLLGFIVYALVFGLIALQPAHTSAATTDITGGTNGPLCNSGGYFTPAAVTVTSGDTITFSVPANDPYAGGVQVNGFPQGSFVVPRGGSVTTQALTANVSYQGTWPNSPSCIKGSGTITVQAAPATSSPSAPPASSSSPSTSTSTSSTSATSTPKSTNAATTPAVSTPAASTTQSTAAPETVVADTVTVSGRKVTSIQNLTISPSQPLVLAGTTVPNGKITLTIHSNPTTATVQANASGDWSYTVTGLLPGSHTIYATVTNPSNNQISASSKLLAFTIATAPVANVAHTTQTPPQKTSSRVVIIGISALVVAILAIAAVLILKMKSKTKANLPVQPQTVPPSSDTPLTVSSGLQTPPTVTTPQAEVVEKPAVPSESVADEKHEGDSV